MSFLWCHVLEPGKPTSFSFTRPLVIRNASLGHTICDTKSRTSVQIRYTESGVEKATFLCSLVPGKFEQFSFYVTLDVGVRYTAELIGKNTVYLVGSYAETDKLPDMSVPKPPMAVDSNLHIDTPPPAGSVTTSQDIVFPENVHIPSSEPSTQPTVIEPSTKRKTGRTTGSKVDKTALVPSRMVTRSTTAVGTRSRVTSKFASATTSEASGALMPIMPAQSPLLSSMPTLPSWAVGPALPNHPVDPLSPLKATLEVTPPVPTDNPTTTVPPMQWANTLVSRPSKSINENYTLASSTFSTLSNLQPTTHQTSSSPDVLRVPIPPTQSSLVVHPPTSGESIIDSSPAPTQPTYVCVRDLKVGAGPLVRPQSTVSVRYRGKIGDTKGPVFAENLSGPPFKFCVGGPDVFPGFSDGVIGMAKGGKRTMFVPPAFGFGSHGNNKVPPNSPLAIECEVLEID